MADLVSLTDIQMAADRIASHVLRTPTLSSPGLSAHLGVPVTVKLELLQRSGSFKTRGAFAKLLTLSEREREAGVVTVSGGNHGLALADAAGALKIGATIVMPRTAPAASIEGARAFGADVRLTSDMPSAFALTHDLVAAGQTLVHPFDDPIVLAGQGTVGLELATDAPDDLTDVLVSIGGGGLISGTATALHALRPAVRVWGVETAGADTMTRARAAGGPVEFIPTSIVTTLSAPYVSELTYTHVTDFVQDLFIVSDAEAVRGTLTLAEAAKVWAEPAAGCLIPAARQLIDRTGPDTRLGLVICGGNLTHTDLATWVRALQLDDR